MRTKRPFYFYLFLAVLLGSYPVYAFYNFAIAAPQELEQALKAAKSGDAVAQAHVGDIYLFCDHNFRSGTKIMERRNWDAVGSRWGFLSKCNLPEGEKWYRASAEAGNPDGQFGYAVWLDHGGKNTKESLKWLEAAAKQRHLEAAYLLGLWNIKANPKKAFKWIQLAALKNHPDAQRELANLYREGIGVEKSQRGYEIWSRLAAEKDRVDSARHNEKYLQSFPALSKRVAEWKPE